MLLFPTKITTKKLKYIFIIYIYIYIKKIIRDIVESSLTVKRFHEAIPIQHMKCFFREFRTQTFQQ